MKNRLTIRLFLFPLALLMLANAGCSSQSPSVTPLEGKILYGKVTAVSGSSITLNMGTLSLQSEKSASPQGSGQSSQSPQGSGQSAQGSQSPQSSSQSSPQGSGQNAQGSQSPQSSPQGSSESSPQSSQQGQKGSQGGSQPDFSFTPNGEDMTIKVTDLSKLKKQQSGSQSQSPGSSQSPQSSGSSQSSSQSPQSSGSSQSSSPSPQSSGSTQNSPGASQSPSASSSSGSKGSGEALTVEVPASLSDIKVGSVLRITYQGDDIFSITLLIL